MAKYNHRQLQKIMQVQKVWSEYRAKGSTTEWIYRTLIEPNYFISRSTFYEYLTVPVKKMVKEQAQAEAKAGAEAIYH